VQRCQAARRIKKPSASRARLIIFSVEKLLTFAKTGDCRSEFAPEFPRFQAEVWNIFNWNEIAGYLTTLKAVERKKLQRLLYVRHFIQFPPVSLD
jgi:hypothetical protein